MSETAGARLQVALGLLLQRRHRARLYGELLEPFAGTLVAPPTRTMPAPPCSP